MEKLVQAPELVDFVRKIGLPWSGPTEVISYQRMSNYGTQERVNQRMPRQIARPPTQLLALALRKCGQIGTLPGIVQG
jgi:hypothetical protein